VEVDRGISMANVGAPGRGGNMEHKGAGGERGGKGAGEKNPRGKTTLHGQLGGESVL